MTHDRRHRRGRSCLPRAALRGPAHSSLGSYWVSLSKDLRTLDGLGGKAAFYRDLLRLVLLACRADRALALEIDPALGTSQRALAHVYPQPTSAQQERLWAYVAGYVRSALREGVDVRLPQDLRDALDIASMLVVPAFRDKGVFAVVAVFSGASSPPLGADVEQLLHALASLFPDVANHVARRASSPAGAPRLLRLLKARGALRSAGRLCCVLDAATYLIERTGFADAVTFRALNVETGELEVIASSGRTCCDRMQDPVPASRCRAVGAATEGVVVQAGEGGEATCPLLRGPERTRRGQAVCVPVRVGREVAAVMEVWLPQGERLDATAMRLVEAVAEMAGKALAEASIHPSRGESDFRSSIIDTFAIVSKTSSDPAYVAATLLRALHAAVAFDVGAVVDCHDKHNDVAIVQLCSFHWTRPDNQTGRGAEMEADAEGGARAGAEAELEAVVEGLSTPGAPGTHLRCTVGDEDARAWVNQVMQMARPFSDGLSTKRLYLPDARWHVGLIVPLAVAGSVVAFLVLGRVESAGFSRGKLEFLESVREGLADLWDGLVRRTRPSWRAAEQAMAERIATLEQLAAGAAHEIKNPLSVIKGYLQVIQADPGTSDVTKKRIGRLFRQLDQINDVVEDFSQLVRPVTPELAPLSLTGMLEEVVEIVEAQASNIGVKIVRSYAEDTPEVMADGGKLQQVFLNLCRNSLEAMAPVGGGELRVSTRTSAEGRAVEIEFRDTGPGMTSEVMSRIFSPFYTTKKHGTGLGLTISMHIAKQHGGTIRAQSTPGAGATFTVVLPITQR